MTLRLYAQRKKLPLDRVTVEVSHGKVYPDDCAAAVDPPDSVNTRRPAMIDRFERVITVEGPDLSDEDRTRLLAIADKCPVHRTLEASSSITTRLAP